jgi:arginine N-succinyltransferase
MTSLLLRSARQTDLSAVYHLAKQRGMGMTSLPYNINQLEQRLAWSESSFQTVLQHPNHEYYWFILEDTDTQHVMGVSAIESFTGQPTPLYSFCRSKHTQQCDSLNIRTDYELLTLVNDNQARSELCTLFLDPLYRKKHNGHLLSRARFLFIANAPQRFTPCIIAEMRGICDDEGRSPFWDSIGQHFFQMTFSEADKLTLATNKHFIADLMPPYPFYINLLSPSAQAVIGKPHNLTQGALKILLREGFQHTRYVDLFDAGPTIEAQRDQIHTVKHSTLVTINTITNNIEQDTPLVMLSNTELDFRATLAHVSINEHDSSCTINQKTAQLLHVTRGSQVRIAPESHL